MDSPGSIANAIIACLYRPDIKAMAAHRLNSHTSVCVQPGVPLGLTLHTQGHVPLCGCFSWLLAPKLAKPQTDQFLQAELQASPPFRLHQLLMLLMDLLPALHCRCLCSTEALRHTINWYLLPVISARSKTLRSLAHIYAPQNSRDWFTFTLTHISYHNHITFSKNIS